MSPEPIFEPREALSPEREGSFFFLSSFLNASSNRVWIWGAQLSISFSFKPHFGWCSDAGVYLPGHRFFQLRKESRPGMVFPRHSLKEITYSYFSLLIYYAILSKRDCCFGKTINNGPGKWNLSRGIPWRPTKDLRATMALSFCILRIILESISLFCWLISISKQKSQCSNRLGGGAKLTSLFFLLLRGPKSYNSIIQFLQAFVKSFVQEPAGSKEERYNPHWLTSSYTKHSNTGSPEKKQKKGVRAIARSLFFLLLLF